MLNCEIALGFSPHACRQGDTAPAARIAGLHAKAASVAFQL